MRTLLLCAVLVLPVAPAGAQSLTLPITPERVLDTTAVFGYPLTIVQPVEADGYVVTEEFLLRDDLRGDLSTHLYFVVSLHADGAYCSPGWHPQVMLPPSLRDPLQVWAIQGIHKLMQETGKGQIAQYPLPYVVDRCGM